MCTHEGEQVVGLAKPYFAMAFDPVCCKVRGLFQTAKNRS